MVGRKSFQKRVIVEMPLTRARVRKIRLRVQARHEWSLREVSAFLGYDHSYLLKIESGKRPITVKFRDRFRVLEDEAHRLGLTRARVETIIVSKFPLPKRLEILAHPVKCDRCHRWFVPVTNGQKRHRKCPSNS